MAESAPHGSRGHVTHGKRAFFERESELAAVDEALSELCGLSRDGAEPWDRPRGALIAFAGRAGLGKISLLGEARRRAAVPKPRAAPWRRPAAATRSSGSGAHLLRDLAAAVKGSGLVRLLSAVYRKVGTDHSGLAAALGAPHPR